MSDLQLNPVFGQIDRIKDFEDNIRSAVVLASLCIPSGLVYANVLAVATSREEQRERQPLRRRAEWSRTRKNSCRQSIFRVRGIYPAPCDLQIHQD